jgi:hypothetical protein
MIFMVMILSLKRLVLPKAFAVCIQVNAPDYCLLPISTFFTQNAEPYLRMRSAGIPFAIRAAW